MNKKGFFEALLSECTSNEEKAVRLLHLLGYFIHEKDGEYYLSDNASSQDAEVLEGLFRTYSLGENRRQIPPKVMRRDEQALFYPQDKSIMDLSFSVSEDSIAVIINECFKSVRVGCEAGPWNMTWSDFLKGKQPAKISAVYLEPFIASYVKAASACGVSTCYSCDGNHINGGKVICRSDYPFSIFHKRIWQDVSTKFEIKGNIEKGIPFDDDSQYDLYYKIYQAAHYLYENRIHYRDLKYEAIIKLRNYRREMKKNKKNPTSDQYEEWFRKEIGLI